MIGIERTEQQCFIGVLITFLFMKLKLHVPQN